MKPYSHFKYNTKYQIEMIDVGNGDCFIIQYYYSEEKYWLILVDSGYKQSGEVILKHLNSYYPGHAIDLAIITHDDFDHYGGLIYLLEQIEQEEPNAVYVNNIIANGLMAGICKYGNLKELVTRLNSKNFNIKSYNSFDYNVPFSKILKYLFPDRVIFESMGWMPDGHSVFESFIKQTSPSKITSIDDETDDYSDTNGASIVFLFLPDGLLGDKFLFTGDATRKTLLRVMENYPEEISNCRWLKVPHHGSVHNLTTALIKKINPKVAYVSTNNPEEAQDIIDALKDIDTKVFSTHFHHTILRRCNTVPRDNWSEIQPL